MKTLGSENVGKHEMHSTDLELVHLFPSALVLIPKHDLGRNYEELEIPKFVLNSMN